jgi:hypothetical protein
MMLPDPTTQQLLNRSFRTYMLLGRPLMPLIPVDYTLDDLAAMLVWPDLRRGVFFLIPTDTPDDPGQDIRMIPISVIQEMRFEAQTPPDTMEGGLSVQIQETKA